MYSTDDTRIRDFFAKPDLDKNYENGIFSIDVSLKNYSNQKKAREITVSILDENKKRVSSWTKTTEIIAEGEEIVNLYGTVLNPLKWTAETPNLYTLLLTLKDEKGNLIETTSSKIGFRKVEINDGQLFINGKKIFLKGVNLHEFNTNNGNVVNEEIMMRNIQLMKELNINAVRTSHYPQSPLWYRLCDKYGIYLVDEANQNHMGWVMVRQRFKFS